MAQATPGFRPRDGSWRQAAADSPAVGGFVMLQRIPVAAILGLSLFVVGCSKQPDVVFTVDYTGASPVVGLMRKDAAIRNGFVFVERREDQSMDNYVKGLW